MHAQLLLELQAASLGDLYYSVSAGFQGLKNLLQKLTPEEVSKGVMEQQQQQHPQHPQHLQLGCRCFKY